MDRYKASPTLRIFRVGVFLIALISGALFLVIRSESASSIVVLISAVICVFYILVYLWDTFTEPLLGKFTFDDKAVTVYMPFRQIVFEYEDCEDIGVVRWIGERNILYFVYLSKKEFPTEVDYLFFKRPKWSAKKKNCPVYKEDYILFECCNLKIMQKFPEHLPERHRAKFAEDEERLIGPVRREYYEL